MPQRARVMTDNLRELIVCNIDALRVVKNNGFDEAWVDECGKTLQYILDNESILDNPDFPVDDLYLTFHLIHDWLINEDYGAYVELSQKYKPVFSPEQAGIAFKKIAERMRSLD